MIGLELEKDMEREIRHLEEAIEKHCKLQSHRWLKLITISEQCRRTEVDIWDRVRGFLDILKEKTNA